MHDKLFFNMKFTIMTNLIACLPKHDFFLYLFKAIGPKDDAHPLNVQRIFIAYKQYLLLNGIDPSVKNEIAMAPEYMFNPHVTEDKIKWMTDVCNKVKLPSLQKIACKEVKA